uniref:Uncharacterized protein n=1 Tax=Magallana gigas TaxID=29159 RepID=A0A8W8NX88_MAGGI
METLFDYDQETLIDLAEGRDCPTATNRVTPTVRAPDDGVRIQCGVTGEFQEKTGIELYITGNMTLT